ncbi:MAG: DEAD/DEAH box helicase [Phycisphaerales bacterium]
MMPDEFASLGLAPQLIAALGRMRITQPTRPQRAALPPALEGRDVVVVAPTGTGKTLAYVLPVAQRLLQNPPPKVRGRPVDARRRLRALVLCPTRELAQQVAREAEQLFKGSVLRAGAVYGKSALPPQRQMVQRGVDLLVGTPGRVRELCELDAMSLAWVQQVVLDEADRMLDLGFMPQAKDILSRAPASRQLLFFTATLPRPVEALVQELLKDPVRADLSHGTPNKVTGTPQPRHDAGQLVMDVPDEDKPALTVALVKDADRKGVIVFCRTRRRAGWVAEALRRHSISVALLHGDRSQKQRQLALEEFASGRARVLVATDVAARGLHVPATRTVINYDVPLLPEEYVHRVGRAGHGGGFAEAISFRCPADAERWRRVERLAKVETTVRTPPPYRAYVRDRMGRAPDVERPAPKPLKKAKPDRRAADEPMSLAALIRRGKKGAGKRSGLKQRRHTARKAPIAKGQKPGRGVKRA